MSCINKLNQQKNGLHILETQVGDLFPVESEKLRAKDWQARNEESS